MQCVYRKPTSKHSGALSLNWKLTKLKSELQPSPAVIRAPEEFQFREIIVHFTYFVLHAPKNADNWITRQTVRKGPYRRLTEKNRTRVTEVLSPE